MTKIGGFLSDAYSVEWAYGKLQVVKKAMAAALARLVEAGFAREEDLPGPAAAGPARHADRDLYDLAAEGLVIDAVRWPRVAVVIPTLERGGDDRRLPPLTSRSRGPTRSSSPTPRAPTAPPTSPTEAGARVVRSPRGRGTQQNRGAAAVGGDLLVFLHADCRLEAGADRRRSVGSSADAPGSRPAASGCASTATTRSSGRSTRRPTSGPGSSASRTETRGSSIPRWAFDRVGGFPEVPLMEDVFIAKRLAETRADRPAAVADRRLAAAMAAARDRRPVAPELGADRRCGGGGRAGGPVAVLSDRPLIAGLGCRSPPRS